MRETYKLGDEVARDPYSYLLSQKELQSAKNLIPRYIFNAGALGATALYYLTRNKEMHRLKTLSISLDLVFGLVWRMAIVSLVADQVSRRMFVNYALLR